MSARRARSVQVSAALMLVAVIGGCGLGGNKAPVSSFTHVLDRDSAPATLTLDASSSSDADGSVVAFSWNIAGDLRTGAVVSVVLPSEGDYHVTLTVTDDEGATHSSSRTFTIREARPDVVPPVHEVLELSARIDQFTVSSYTLGNLGSLSLEVSIIADPWLDVDPATVTLPGASLHDFVVHAHCGSDQETRVGVVTMTTNDPDQPLIALPVTLECTAPPASDFDIQILFAPGTITPSQQAIFLQAASRWQEVITGDLPDVPGVTQGNVDSCLGGFVYAGGTVDDLLILARGAVIDGPGGVLGSAGPCWLRGGSGLPFMGRMSFDEADLAAMEANGSLLGVVMHEIGHVLNLNSGAWSGRGFLDYDAATCLSSSTVTYNGANAVARWQALGGTGDVPVEANGVSGTACSHWDEGTFGIELMTGYIALETALSTVTIGGLDDLGYEVDYAAADPYALPADSPVRSSSAPTRIVEEILPPIGILLPDGTPQRFDDQ